VNHRLHIIDMGVEHDPRIRFVTACDCGWWDESGPRAIGRTLRAYSAHSAMLPHSTFTPEPEDDEPAKITVDPSFRNAKLKRRKP
jgi:hypothetical protein